MTGDAYSVLRQTRQRLSDPAAWAKGYGHGPQGPTCVALTMTRYSPKDSFTRTLGEACQALLCAVGIEPDPCHSDMLEQVFAWHDDPATTHADLMAALDKALAV